MFQELNGISIENKKVKSRTLVIHLNAENSSFLFKLSCAVLLQPCIVCDFTAKCFDSSFLPFYDVTVIHLISPYAIITKCIVFILLQIVLLNQLVIKI